jgi:lysophospholipase L1-like esterase
MRKLPIIIIILVAFLILLSFSPAITRVVKNWFGPATNTNSRASSANTPSPKEAPLINRHIPSFASTETYPASSANDDSYDTTWRSNSAPAWLTYDLSKLPIAKRSKVLVVWYNGTGNYDHTLLNNSAYNMPQDYTIDVNSATGGGNPPTEGWVTLETVRGNHYHSRQHTITMTGYNWLRINITAIDGSLENYDASINMDIYDASTALADDWIFFGDSITAGAMGQQSLNGTASFAQLINAHAPNNYPAQESGGIGYFTSAEGMTNLNTWLQLFPGKYIGLSYGTNDTLACLNPATFYNNYVTMVQDVIKAGKIPLVPYIPWGPKDTIQQCGPVLNGQITNLYRAFPQIIHGPDLWSFFQSHQNLISDDNIHPTDAGLAAYRQQWANAILTEVYNAKP